MNHVYILITIFLVTHFSSQAQTKEDYYQQWEDSVNVMSNIKDQLRLSKETLPKVNEIGRMKIHLVQGNILRSQRKIDSSIYYYDKAIALGMKNNMTDYLSSTYAQKAMSLAFKNDNENAISYLIKARKILTKDPNSKHWNDYYGTYSYMMHAKGDYEKAIKYRDSIIGLSQRLNLDKAYTFSAYYNKGTAYYMLSDYDNAIKTYLATLDFAKTMENPINVEAVYLMIGTSHLKLEQYNTASLYFEKTIKKARELNNKYFLMVSYSRKASAEIKLNRNEHAHIAADSALLLAKAYQDQGRIADALEKKGTIYFENLKEYDKAESYYNKAYDAILKAGSSKNADDLTLQTVLQNLIKIYLHKKDYMKAGKYLGLLKKETLRLGTISYLQDMNYYSSLYYEGIGQHKNALRHLKNYLRIKDSLANIAVKTKIADLEKKYDAEKKALEIATLNREKEAQDQALVQEKLKQRLLLIGISILVGVLSLGFWFYKKLRTQKEDLNLAYSKLSTLDTIKNRLFSIISHDLRSMVIPFQRTGRMIKFHLDHNNNERAITIAKELGRNSESLSNMLDNLLNWSLDQMNGYSYKPSKISVYEELNTIVTGFGQQASYKNIKIEIEYNEDIVVLFDKGAFHVIFRNLIGNALKYTENGRIIVSFKKVLNTLHFLVIDNGVGMTKSQIEQVFELDNNKTTPGTQGEKGIGIGLNLVNRFVTLHQGVVKVSSEKSTGTKFDLTFTLPETNEESVNEFKVIPI